MGWLVVDIWFWFGAFFCCFVRFVAVLVLVVLLLSGMLVFWSLLFLFVLKSVGMCVCAHHWLGRLTCTCYWE